MESILLKAKTLLFTIFAERDMTNILGLKKNQKKKNQKREGGFLTQDRQHS